jgi:hypothetical protein
MLFSFAILIFGMYLGQSENAPNIKNLFNIIYTIAQPENVQYVNTIEWIKSMFR